MSVIRPTIGCKNSLGSKTVVSRNDISILLRLLEVLDVATTTVLTTSMAITSVAVTTVATTSLEVTTAAATTVATTVSLTTKVVAETSTGNVENFVSFF